MKDKFIRFMYGRYGMDSFGRTLVTASLIGYFCSLFMNWNLLYLFSLFALIYAYYRMFSRNLYRRAAENQVFLTKTAFIRSRFSKQLSLLRQLRTHHIYRCPTCRQKIRIPRGKGRIEIRCPKCHSTFIKNS